MYTPSYFKESRIEALHGLIHDFPFATVVTHGDAGLVANHLPFELVGDNLLHGHVARGNELRNADGAEVLLIFRGPDGYISPNWYPSKHETGREVPTWNYAVVHVHGRLRVIEDAAWLRTLLDTLTEHHEAGLPTPWKVSDAPHDFTEKLIGAVVGIEIEIVKLQGKWKVSQNQPHENRVGVVRGLEESGNPNDALMAEWVKAVSKET